ncbi:MAG: hypothetical protein GC171_03440 [Terrimonas sp.]|nr:hypothetical protein [Terrimonas sp.]
MIKKSLILSVVFLFTVLFSKSLSAQCSICTRTAQQLGEEPAKGLNAGILYLAALPLTIMGVVYFQWKKKSD